MKKEQILLVVAVGVAGLLVSTSTGLYESVGTLPGDGRDVDVKQTTPANPQEGIKADPPLGRNFLRQKRVEHRKDPPELDLPPGIGVPWIRPLPWPELPPAFWGGLREPMTPVAKAAAAATDAAAAEANPATTEEEDPAVVAARDAAAEKAKEEAAARERIANAAKLVGKDGKEIAVRVIPLGELQGAEVWRLLERWPNCRFTVEELNNDGKTVRGRYEADPAKYSTIHLEKTLDNEYNEERIRRGVKEGDRQSNVEFAQWVRTALTPKYGVPAIRFALKHLAAAKAVQFDAALVSLIGDTCRDAYDIDEEIKAYTEYLQGTRATETPIIVRLGDAYERAGAVQAAQDQYDKAAKLGDNEGRLRHALVSLGLARGGADLQAVYDEFEKSQTGAQRGRALAGMARVRLRQGNVAAATQLAQQARDLEPSSYDAGMVLGAALYASGQFQQAEAAFAAASATEARGGTRAKSNRSMALLAQDKLTEAVAEAEAALASDALNYFDPLVVAGEAQQRWGDLNKSNDTFQTALQRNPRNAWALLRLAAIRLRDGLPKPALDLCQGGEGVPGLLQIAPESVDGLHIAGLACAAQERPDWTNGVKYLRRALDKEPKNAEITYDLAKVLHLAGHTDDAIQLLEHATDSTTGPSKNDARMLALLAYVYFDGSKPVDQVFATFDRARRAPQASWTKEYVDKAYLKVVEWNNTRIWEDDCNRAPGNRVGNGWDESEALGVNVGLNGSAIVFGGKATPAPERPKMTGIIRPEELAPLQAIEVALKADPGFELVVHLYQGELASTDPSNPAASGGGRGRGRSGGGTELGFGRARDGRMMLWIYGGAENKMFNVPVKDEKGADRQWPDDGAVHRVAFRRVGLPQKGEFEIYFDDEKVLTPLAVEIGGLSAAFGKSATLGVHVDADQQAVVSLQIDSVQIEKILGRR